MLLCTVNALGELAVLFPGMYFLPPRPTILTTIKTALTRFILKVNGAFYTYVVRFVDPSL